MRAVSRVVLIVVAATMMNACATKVQITGRVVDRRGRPVSQALVGVGFLQSSQHDPVEHVWFAQKQADNAGRFDFVVPRPLERLTMRADSPDLKHTGGLLHVHRDNIIVVE